MEKPATRKHSRKKKAPARKHPATPKRRRAVKAPLPIIRAFTALPEVCKSRPETPSKILVPTGTAFVLRWEVAGATSVRIEARSRKGRITAVRVPKAAQRAGEIARVAREDLSYVLFATNAAGEVRGRQEVDVATFRPVKRKGRMAIALGDGSMWLRFSGRGSESSAPAFAPRSPESVAVIGPSAMPPTVHAPALLDFRPTALRMRSMAGEPDALRSKVVQEILQMEDFGIGDTPAGRKDAYGDIIAGTDPAARADLLRPGANASSCALAVRSLWRFLGARDGSFAGSGAATHLDKFRIGKVFSDVIAFAKRCGAWVDHVAGKDDVHPKEGDTIVLYKQAGSTIKQHMLTVVGVNGDVYTSVDGGRPKGSSQADGPCNGIHRAERTFLRAEGRFQGDDRPVLGWVDVTRLVFADPIVELVKNPPAPLDEAGFFALASATKFTSGAEVDAWFTANTGSGFIDWFDADCANKDAWAGKTLSQSADVKARFVTIWDNIPTFFGRESCSLLQFLCLMSIFINEVGASLQPRSEIFGTAEHPGVSYLFDKIQGLKVSYNQSSLNRTAFACFNDPGFLAAHGGLPKGAALAKTTDTRWQGAAYPSGVSTSGDPAVNGFILQSDFFKFRGRGFIQTTWRASYKRIIEWVQGYTGSQATIVKYRNQWKGRSLDDAATISTTQGWDELFQQSGFAIPALAVHLHDSGGGGYLNLSTDLATAKGTGSGSIYNVGKTISGGTAYATKFKGRVLQAMSALRERVNEG